MPQDASDPKIKRADVKPNLRIKSPSICNARESCLPDVGLIRNGSTADNTDLMIDFCLGVGIYARLDLSGA